MSIQKLLELRQSIAKMKNTLETESNRIQTKQAREKRRIEKEKVLKSIKIKAEGKT